MSYEYEWTADEAIDWFGSSWECLLAVIEHCDLFAKDNEEFARVEKVVTEDEVFIYWDDGLAIYPKVEVEGWTRYDFASDLALYDEDAFIAVMKRERNIILRS